MWPQSLIWLFSPEQCHYRWQADLCQQHETDSPVNVVSRRTAQSAAVTAALSACLFVAGCVGEPSKPQHDEPETAAIEELPPLDEPQDEPVTTASDDEPPQPDQDETSTDEAPEEFPPESAGGQAEPESGSPNGMLDVTEFSAEAQESNGFPELLTDVPEDSHLLLEEVRVGIHEGYHRIVFEHSGTGAPGWAAEYVDEAVEPGSGFPIEMDSESILYLGVVGLEPGNAGQSDGHLELGNLVDTQGTVFSEAVTTFVHHGSASYYIGLDTVRDYRVSVWEHPDGPRLIIDVLV